MRFATPEGPPAPGHARRALDAEELHGVEALEALRPEWSDLCDRCPWATPFQRPEWLLPWARHFGGEATEAITLRDDALAGLLPLYFLRHGSERVVELLGLGLSDYLDVVLDPARAPGGAQRLVEQLLRRGEIWNTLSFDALRLGSPLLQVTFPPGWREDIAPRMPTLVLPLEQLESRQSRRLRASLRQSHRRAALAGGARFEQVRGTAVTPALEALFLLHQRRWNQRGQPGLFASEAVRAFVREVAREFEAAGKLRLYTLRVGGRLAAVDLGFRDGERAFACASGFDLAFGRLRPGLLLTEHSLLAAREEGARTFDFLRGQEPHKLLWGAEEQVVCRRELRPAVF